MISCHITTRRCNLEDEDLDMNLHPEDGGSMDLRNVGILSQYYTASQSSHDLNIHCHGNLKSRKKFYWMLFKL